jgi:hypothetical protein
MTPPPHPIPQDDLTEPVSWLAQFPAPRRSGLAELFYRVVRRGETSASEIVQEVVAEVYRKLQWTADFEKRQFWCQVINTLQDDPQPAQAYAETVCAMEALPPEEKAARKLEKSKAYALESMRGKPITDKQRALILAKGYTSEIPNDRWEASKLIDALLRGRGTR